VLVRVQELVLALGVAEDFQRPVGDHLVGVHVGRGAGAALDDVDDELLMPLAVDDFLAGGDDGVGALGVEQAELQVSLGGGLLDLGQGANQVRVDGNRNAGDVEVFQGAQRMDAVIGALGTSRSPSRSCSRKPEQAERIWSREKWPGA
jgi:hypothetical protein